MSLRSGPKRKASWTIALNLKSHTFTRKDNIFFIRWHIWSSQSDGISLEEKCYLKQTMHLENALTNHWQDLLKDNYKLCYQNINVESRIHKKELPLAFQFYDLHSLNIFS